MRWLCMWPGAMQSRCRSEESLRLMDKQLRSLGDSLPDGVVYRIVQRPDGHGYFDYVSAGFESVF